MLKRGSQKIARPVIAVAAGATVFFFAAAVAQPQEEDASKAPTLTVLHAFTGGTDGSNNNTLLPYDKSLIMDEQGNLYGVTSDGGTYGWGVVFKLDHAGNETVLHAFAGYPADGATPVASLLRDGDGNLYGTTNGGGSYGVGTVFKLDRNGEETVLYSFTGGSDGGFPVAGLLRDEAGNLYGTASGGGIDEAPWPSPCASGGCGVVFRVDCSGKETVLYSFTGGADGANPRADLIQDKEGNFYSTTLFGGNFSSTCATFGCGTVFKLNVQGKEAVLHAFAGGTDGSDPVAGVVRDEEGNLYGTTSSLVFKLSPAGIETVLHNFTDATDGEGLEAGLIRDRQGNLYGTTFNGGDLTSPACYYGDSGCGVVFKLDPAGKETVLYSFPGGTDGSNPESRLIADKEGNLYGSTFDGGDLTGSCGSYGCGAVFKLSTHGDCMNGQEANNVSSPQND